MHAFSAQVMLHRHWHAGFYRPLPWGSVWPVRHTGLWIYMCIISLCSCISSLNMCNLCMYTYICGCSVCIKICIYVCTMCAFKDRKALSLFLVLRRPSHLNSYPCTLDAYFPHSGTTRKVCTTGRACLPGWLYWRTYSDFIYPGVCVCVCVRACVCMHVCVCVKVMDILPPTGICLVSSTKLNNAFHPSDVVGFFSSAQIQCSSAGSGKNRRAEEGCCSCRACPFTSTGCWWVKKNKWIKSVV